MSVYRKQTRMVLEQSATDAEQTAPTETEDEPVAVEAELTESPAETEVEPVAAEAELTESPAETADEPVAVEAEPTEEPTVTEPEAIAVEAEPTEAPTETADDPVAELTESPAETADEPAAAEAELTESPAETEVEPVAVEAELTEAPAETEDEPVAATRTFAGRLRAMLPGRRSKAAATSPADDEASPALDDADSETPLDTEEDADVPTFVASTTLTEAEDEPVTADKQTLAGRLRSMWPGRRSKAAATSPADDEASPASVDADSETPLDTEMDGGVPTFEAPKADPAANDEPVAVEAALSEPLIDVPDSPFPIEAALAAKARLQQAQATPNERPALRIVSSSDTDDEVPAFLLEQIKRREAVGGRLIDQQAPEEKSVA